MLPPSHTYVQVKKKGKQEYGKDVLLKRGREEAKRWMDRWCRNLVAFKNVLVITERTLVSS